MMERETVAIIPQFSLTAIAISNVVNELRVPTLSFSATDPALSSFQYPFFVRTTHSDVFQMAAIAQLIDYYGWRHVTAIYVDDDLGRNGIAALGDKLEERRCKISYKALLSPLMNRDEITNVLYNVTLMESRILVLLAYSDWGLQVLEEAQHLGMMGTGYVWIITDWLSTVLDSKSPPPSEVMNNIQGVLILRMYTPDTPQKSKFTSRWSKLMSGEKAADSIFGLNTYGLYAYDTVWMLAYAMEAFFNQGRAVSFSRDPRLNVIRGGNAPVDDIRIFNEGNLLLNNIFQVNMTGVTGPIKFTSERDLIHPAYEIINVIGTGIRRIGYWSSDCGLTVDPPEKLYTNPSNHSSQELYGVIWPGQTTLKPRGWVFPDNGKHLRVGVPNRVIYRDFVSVDGADTFTGYCIDVFTAALKLLPYAVSYKFYAFGDGHNNPDTNELLKLITDGVYDAAVGDISITTNRIRMVEFTQPYVESGLVVVAPVKGSNSNAWAFLKPFTITMWCVTGIFFLFVGVVVWVLERRVNDAFRGPPRRQLGTILWFSFSTMVFSHKEKTMSTLGRFVLIIWLFVVLILNSSYTASLSSILTVDQLSSPIKGIEGLVSGNVPIGYPRGSYAGNYLVDGYKIAKSRLVPLNSMEEYANALKSGPENGGVAAVVDERAQIEFFLSTRCEYGVVGQEFSKIGWGFAFARDSPLAFDMSTAILKLSEGGELQRIHDKWLLKSACSSEGKKEEAKRLELKSFWGLFLLCGIACSLALILHVIKMVRQFAKHCAEDLELVGQSSRSARLQTFLTFVSQMEEEVKPRSKRRRTVEGASNRSMVVDESMVGHFERPTSGIEV